MKKSKMILIVIILVLVMAACLLGYTGYGYYVKQTFKPENPVVTMEIEGYGTIKIELYPNMAPDTVRNFIKLINEGYYNGLPFHRVEKDMLIQGGDKAGDGSGTNDYSVKGEFSANGFKDNNLNFERGTIRTSKTGFFFTCFVRSYCDTKRV